MKYSFVEIKTVLQTQDNNEISQYFKKVTATKRNPVQTVQQIQKFMTSQSLSASTYQRGFRLACAFNFCPDVATSPSTCSPHVSPSTCCSVWTGLKGFIFNFFFNF